jgi:hypothetical protein
MTGAAHCPFKAMNAAWTIGGFLIARLRARARAADKRHGRVKMAADSTFLR